MFSMGQPEEVVELAFPYLKWVAVSLFPLIVFQAFKQFTDGMSLTRYSMYATVLANLVNVLVNYVLIFGKVGFSRLGCDRCCNWNAHFSRLVMLFALIVLIRYHKHLSNYYQRNMADCVFKNSNAQTLSFGLSICSSNAF